MRQTLTWTMEHLVERACQIMENERLTPCEASEIVNSVVDLLVQANIDLGTVTLEDMKRLLTDALDSRRRMMAVLS